MPRGGKRPGAGNKKGNRHAATISKEQAREALRTVILEQYREMTEAQIAHAKGLKYLVARNKKTGKFAKLTEDMLTAIVEGADTEHEAIEVWSKDPSVQAFTDLMNRALDKPAEQEQAVAVTGTLEIVWKGRKPAEG